MAVVTPLETRRSVGVDPISILQTHDLNIGYAGRPPRLVAEQINLSLHAGELISLIGPNGAGKSTLIRTLAGMQMPLAGSVTLMGDDVHQLPARDLARRLSVVLTERVNPGLLTVRTLVSLGRHPHTNWSGRLTARDDIAVQRAIQAVGAAALAERQMIELSDGERQKVMIARALAQEPALLILDEPTAFLDLPRRVEIMQLLRRLAHDSGCAVLISTHDLDLALRTADRIWLMPASGALQVGAPEDLVLSGAFEAAFRSEGVVFDAQTGAFRISSRTRGHVRVLGEGLPALWTRRALERAGFTASGGEGAALARVEVEPSRWRLTHGDATAVYESLYDLIEAVRAL